MTQPVFLTLIETAEVLRIPVSTLQKFCARREINPKCGKKFGKSWRFRRDLVEAGEVLNH